MSNALRNRIHWLVLTGAAITLAGIWSWETSTIAGAASARENDRQYDIIVYGGTSAGVMAAVQARRMGRSVALVCPDEHLGGLSSGGLGWTDTGNKAVIGGLAREFYHRVWRHYQSPEAWRQQDREQYGNRGQGTPAIDGERRTMWIFEPHVAEAIFEAFVREHDIPVFRDQWLERPDGVRMRDGRITSIRMTDGTTYGASAFIDATYEGDLMATAGVRYTVGRESNAVYAETWNGVQKDARHHAHFFPEGVDPYIVPGDPESGLLPLISDQPPGENGQGDHRVQAYCFRMCLTDYPDNRVPFPKPEGYDPRTYELLLRVFDTGWRATFNKFDRIPNWKTDTNNHGPFSTDYIGQNYEYPEASYRRRAEIVQEHERYQKGLMYFIANDPRVPRDVQTEMRKWGLAKDEFVDNGHWPHQLYIREARRMIGSYVMTEHDVMDRCTTPHSVGMGSYSIDSHNVQRYVTKDHFVQNEGDIGRRPPRPYEIAYGALLPDESECTNLVVPVCVSASHAAYGSIRMEPVFMILGQSAATAVSLALDDDIPVQEVDYAELKSRLVEDGQILHDDSAEPAAQRGLSPIQLGGIVIDDIHAERDGFTATSTARHPFVGLGYRHDNDDSKGEQSARFTANLPRAGRYEVRLLYSPDGNRASNVPVVISHAAGETACEVDQRRTPEIDQVATSLGTFEFDAGKAAVEISNRGTDGHVIIDAVQFIPRNSEQQASQEE